MPSFPYTPAQLVLTGGEFFPEPIRFSYNTAALTLTGGTFAIGAGLSSTDGDRLARLKKQTSYFDKEGHPSPQMMLHWQRTMERIEARFGNIEDVLAQIQQAQATAASAVQQSQATEAKVNFANSRTEPVAGNLSATSDGAITISAHSRVYGDGTTVAVNGGSLSGFTPGQFVRVYYQDAAHAGGAVTYQGTLEEIVQEGATHVVGGALIPELGEAPLDGQGLYPPGYVFNPFEF